MTLLKNRKISISRVRMMAWSYWKKKLYWKDRNDDMILLKRKTIWVGSEWWSEPMQVKFEKSLERCTKLHKLDVRNHRKDSWCYATHVWENSLKRCTILHKLNMKSNQKNMHGTIEIKYEKNSYRKKAWCYANQTWENSHWKEARWSNRFIIGSLARWTTYIG